MERVAVVAITKNGVRIGRKIASAYDTWHVHAPSKFDDGDGGVMWFDNSTAERLGSLFASYDGIVCIFSLGAVIRLLAPHIRDKKSDPAVLVVDDCCEFVISALSGHIGGANDLARDIAKKMGAIPVITTAADVNRTIAVDLVGRNAGWRIDGNDNVTKLSAMMVNAEKIGVYQDAGDSGMLGKTLPQNVATYDSIESLSASDCVGALVITDRIIGALPKPAVIYRPRTLVVGVGIHRDTPAPKILESLALTLERAGLSPMSVACLASVKKPTRVASLDDVATRLGVSLELFERSDLAGVDAPNPSETVARLEGTPSVSEAAALACSNGGRLVVQKQKFPPDLTLAVARVS